jgi:hypothetical protein
MELKFGKYYKDSDDRIARWDGEYWFMWQEASDDTGAYKARTIVTTQDFTPVEETTTDDIIFI